MEINKITVILGNGVHDTFSIGDLISDMVIDSIIRSEGTNEFTFFDAESNPILSIIDCPVYIKYKK